MAAEEEKKCVCVLARLVATAAAPLSNLEPGIGNDDAWHRQDVHEGEHDIDVDDKWWQSHVLQRGWVAGSMCQRCGCCHTHTHTQLHPSWIMHTFAIVCANGKSWKIFNLLLIITFAYWTKQFGHMQMPFHNYRHAYSFCIYFVLSEHKFTCFVRDGLLGGRPLLRHMMHSSKKCWFNWAYGEHPFYLEASLWYAHIHSERIAEQSTHADAHLWASRIH